jgi:hypothetical protein
MSSDEQATDEQARDEPDESGRNTEDDPNESTEGLLDEESLRAHAKEVSDAIQEAKNRNA